jgi:predicted MFS family arabinose efflux permease
MTEKVKGPKIVLSPRKIALLAVIGFVQGVIFLFPYMSGPYYKPFQEMLGISNAQLGMFMTIIGLTTVIAVFPGGWLADRFDARKLVSLSLLLTGLVGLAMLLSTNYYYYCVIWALFGLISNILYWSAGLKLVRFICTEEEQGKAYGYAYAANGIATYVIGFIGISLLAIAGFSDDAEAMSVNGLRYVIILYAAFNILSALLVFVCFGSKRLTRDTGVSEDAIKEDTPKFREMLAVIKIKQTWIFAIVAFCLYVVMNLIPYYFTPFFTDVLGMSEVAAGYIYMLTGPLAIVAPVILGTFADKLGSVLKVILIVMAFVILILTVLLVINQIMPLWAAMVIDILAYALAGAAYSIQFSIFEEIKLDRKIAGSCIGMASLVAYSSDLFVWTLAGSLLDNYGNFGYVLIFAGALGLAVIAFAGCAVLSKLKNADAKAAA